MTRSRQADLPVSTARSYLLVSASSVLWSRIIFLAFRSFRSSRCGATPCTIPSSQTHYFDYTASACPIPQTRHLSFPWAKAGKSAARDSLDTTRTGWSDQLCKRPIHPWEYILVNSEQHGLLPTVTWLPGPTRGSSTADLARHAFRGRICLPAVQATVSVSLA